MKTLQEIKDEVAKEIVKSDNPIVTWDALSESGLREGVDLVAKKYAAEVAQQVLNDAAERAKVEVDYKKPHDPCYFVDKDSILNTPIITP